VLRGEVRVALHHKKNAPTMRSS